MSDAACEYFSIWSERCIDETYVGRVSGLGLQELLTRYSVSGQCCIWGRKKTYGLL